MNTPAHLEGQAPALTVLFRISGGSASPPDRLEQDTGQDRSLTLQDTGRGGTLTQALRWVIGGWACLVFGASAFGTPHTVSGNFTVDTRLVTRESEATSGNFQVDARALDGLLAWAESGSAALDTGGSYGIPLVQSISPSPVSGSDSRQWLTIHGSGFTSGSVVILRVGGSTYTIPAARTDYVDATEIRVYVNLTTESAEWTAEVMNPGGIASQTLAFQVSPPTVRPDGGIDFGTVAPGETAEKSFVVRNNLASAAALSVNVSGPFALVNGPWNDLAPGAEQTVTVRYSPTSAGSNESAVMFQIGGQSVRRTVSGRSSAVVANTGGLKGVVEGSDGNGGYIPLKNAKVTLNVATSWSDGLYRSAGHSTETDSNGNYALAGIPAGNYLLAITPAPGDLVRYYSVGYGGDPVTVSAGVTGNYSFQLPLLPSDPENIHNMPVVLVRGLGTAGDDEFGYWKALRDHLTAQGFNEVWVPNQNTRPNSTSPVVNGQKGIFDNANALDTYLASKVAGYKLSHQGVSPKKIRFVCHSMGGLIVRQLLSQSRNLPPVSDVVMLSTPNAGSVLADIKAGFAPWSQDWESIFQLRTPFVRNDFKAAWPGGENIRLFLAGGNTSGGSGYYGTGSAAIVAHSPTDDALNDGAVTILSSQGKYIKNDYSKAVGPIFVFLSRPTIAKTPFAEVRATATEQVALNHSTITSDPAMRNWVTEILLDGTPNGIAASAALASGSASSPDLVFSSRSGQESDPPDATVATWSSDSSEAALFGGAASSPDLLSSESLPDQLIERIQGSVNAGGNVTHSTPVDTTAKVTFTVTLDKSAGACSLIDPEGNIITGSGGNVTRQDIVDGEIRIVRFDVVSPTVGVWQTKVDASESADSVGYEVRISCESNFALAGESGGRFRQGSAIPLSAALGDVEAGGVSIVPGAVIGATLESPSGVLAEADLFDDGLHADAEAGDGAFGGSANPASEAGWYSVTYRADGVHPATGQAFRRMLEGEVCVGGGGGFISGEPSYEALDSDENGFADAVRVEIPVTVSGPGNYVVSGKLVDVETGTEIKASTAFVREAAGTANVTLLFSPRDLPEGQVFGPFDLQSVDLFLQLEAPEWADRFSGSLRVFATLYNEFSRSIRITGSLDFGTVPLAQQSARNITLHNDGWESLNVTALTLPSGFAASFAGRIDPGESATVQVRFTPWAEGVYSGQLGVESDAAAGEPFADINGTGGPEEIPMSRWLEENGVPAGQRGPNDDPGGGRPNILAYFFNIHPVSGLGPQDGQALPQAGMVSEAGADYLTLTYRRNRNLTGMSVTYEGSETLGADSWQIVIPDMESEIGTDPNTGDSLIEARIILGTETRKFIRLRVVEQ